jgi:hypothetical protein
MVLGSGGQNSVSSILKSASQQQEKIGNILIKL